jgi:hypothetical protein
MNATELTSWPAGADMVWHTCAIRGGNQGALPDLSRLRAYGRVRREAPRVKRTEPSASERVRKPNSVRQDAQRRTTLFSLRLQQLCAFA